MLEPQHSHYLAVTDSQIEEELAETKIKYFRLADQVLEEINQRYGTDREGFYVFSTTQTRQTIQKKNTANIEYQSPLSHYHSLMK